MLGFFSTKKRLITSIENRDRLIEAYSNLAAYQEGRMHELSELLIEATAQIKKRDETNIHLSKALYGAAYLAWQNGAQDWLRQNCSSMIPYFENRDLHDGDREVADEIFKASDEYIEGLDEAIKELKTILAIA